MTKHATSRVPIVNVFDEDEKQPQSDLQPAHRPVVVEIEDVPHEAVQPPSAPAPQVSVADANVQPVYQEQNVVPPAPVLPPQQPEASTTVSTAPQAPQVEYASAPMAAEPALPSFFEQDLKADVAPATPAIPAAQPMPQSGMPSTQPVSPVQSGVPAQAFVGEINEAAEGGGNTKKLIGIILVVLAIIVLAIGGLFLYAKNLFAPVELPKATPRPLPTVRPVATPAASPVASDSGKVASVSAEMKKKVKVDVLNGTKVAGLASKEAAIIKKAGYTTGTVGNGKPENAGTIVVSPTYKAVAVDIQKILADFTFTVKEDEKMTSVQVTLGEPKE
jgi:hypothetical protein